MMTSASMTTTLINTSTSTTRRGYRLPRNRRGPSRRGSRGAIGMTRTPPLRSRLANMLSSAGADDHGDDAGRIGRRGVSADFFGVVVLRHGVDSDRALPGLLRRQTRIEARVRRRRMHRMARRISAWRTPTTASSMWSRRDCGGPAPWCWRSTTRIRSSSISTMRPTLASTPARGLAASRRQ